MTHDELLAKVRQIEKDKSHFYLRFAIPLVPAVIRHTPKANGRCRVHNKKYPCPTIQAIEKELT